MSAPRVIDLDAHSAATGVLVATSAETRELAVVVGVPTLVERPPDFDLYAQLVGEAVGELTGGPAPTSAPVEVRIDLLVERAGLSQLEADFQVVDALLRPDRLGQQGRVHGLGSIGAFPQPRIAATGRVHPVAENQDRLPLRTVVFDRHYLPVLIRLAELKAAGRRCPKVRAALFFSDKAGES